MTRPIRKALVFSGFVLLAVSRPFAQSPQPPQDSSSRVEQIDGEQPAHPNDSAVPDQTICGITHVGRCFADFGEDEIGIFSSPFRLQPKDAFWLAPLGAATGLAIAHDMNAAPAVGVDASRTTTTSRVADFSSLMATGAGGAGIYFVGLAGHNPKLAETGRLGTEAVIDSGSVTMALKLASNWGRRQGEVKRDFLPYGTSNGEAGLSFPSEHATSVMALARVIAGEYPQWYVAGPAYGFAGAMSMSHMVTIRHSRSDILVGQAIGFLTGNYLLNHRALYSPGAKRRMVMQMIGSVRPMGDVGNRAFGASIDIPIGR